MTNSRVKGLIFLDSLYFSHQFQLSESKSAHASSYCPSTYAVPRIHGLFTTNFLFHRMEGANKCNRLCAVWKEVVLGEKLFGATEEHRESPQCGQQSWGSLIESVTSQPLSRN